MSTPVPFKRVDQLDTEIAEMLEQVAKDLREGKEKARDCIVCWRDRENETIDFRARGFARPSEAMGLLSFVSHMLYADGFRD